MSQEEGDGKEKITKSKRIKKEPKDFFPVVPITFYSGFSSTLYTITDPNDPLVVSKQQLKRDRDVTIPFEVGELVFVLYEKDGSCRPGKVTDKKTFVAKVQDKGKVYNVEKERYTVEAIEHTVAMGRDAEGELWTLFHVKGTRKQPGSTPGQHMSTSLVALKKDVKYYVTKNN